MRARIAASLVTVILAACGGDPSKPRLFSTDWKDDRGRGIAALEGRLRGARNPPSIDVVVAVAAHGDKLVGAPLGRGPAWTFSHAVDARPIVAGSVVVASGGGEVVALDAASGRKMWARPSGGVALLGAGDDGSVTAVVLGTGKASTLLLVGRDGGVRQQIETDKSVGNPAVLAGVVFAPWGNQYVSAIDASTGDEVARATVRDKVTRAEIIGGELYFGELALVRFDERIRLASGGGASRLVIPKRELPGSPHLLLPGNERLPPKANARDRDRLFARPASGVSAVGFDSDRFYATYFRLALGFDAGDRKLAWVFSHSADLIGGAAVVSGIAFCDEAGNVIVLDAKTGLESSRSSLGEPIRSCSIGVASFRAPPPSSSPPPLVDQIVAAIKTKDPSLATAQRLLLRELSSSEDAAATKALIDVVDAAHLPTVLAIDARAALATRRTGERHMLAALAKHYDYLTDVVQTPPVGAIAEALAGMKEKRAAPLLAEHLLDPADADGDVRRVAAALAVLAGKEELPALVQFFSMYRANAQSEDIAFAVAKVAEAVVRIDPKDGRALVEAASRDPMTMASVKERLDAVLSAPSAKSDPARPSRK